MFEIIGIVTVLIILWQVGKAILRGAYRGHRFRSIDHATSLGVPYDKALILMEHHDQLMACIKEIGEHEPNFRMKDAYIQNGEAIAIIYLSHLKQQELEKKSV